jgi:hypothetical protein
MEIRYSYIRQYKRYRPFQMKLFVIIVILFLAACNSTTTQTIVAVKPLNSKDTTITLKDTLGDIRITVPIRYDTFLVWTQHSDCSKCGNEKYRFQPKSLPIFQESGWYWHDRKDSIDQFTIEHPQYIVINDSFPADAIKMLHGRMLEEAKSDPLMYKDKFHLDTVENINGKLFSIITSESYDDSTKLYSKSVWGTTLIKGNSVKFKFALLTSRQDSITTNFIRDSKLLLHQVNSNGL